MVDCAALEMLCTARYRGFESLPLRQLDSSLRSRARARVRDRAGRARRDENPWVRRSEACLAEMGVATGKGAVALSEANQSLPLRQLDLESIDARVGRNPTQR